MSTDNPSNQVQTALSGVSPVSAGSAENRGFVPDGPATHPAAAGEGPSRLPFAELANDTLASLPGPLAAEAHYGQELAGSDDPVAGELAAAGAHFDWMAFALPSLPMWDAHVGVVAEGGTTAAIGLHIKDSREAEAERMRLLAAELGLDVDHSTATREYQVVLARLDLDRNHDAAVQACVEALRHLAALTQ